MGYAENIGLNAKLLEMELSSSKNLSLECNLAVHLMDNLA